jgi:hypothetical protein
MVLYLPSMRGNDHNERHELWWRHVESFDERRHDVAD